MLSPAAMKAVPAALSSAANFARSSSTTEATWAPASEIRPWKSVIPMSWTFVPAGAALGSAVGAVVGAAEASPGSDAPVSAGALSSVGSWVEVVEDSPSPAAATGAVPGSVSSETAAPAASTLGRSFDIDSHPCGRGVRRRAAGREEERA